MCGNNVSTTYIRCEWPRLERFDNQRPVSHCELPDPLIWVDPLVGRKRGTCQFRDEIGSTHAQVAVRKWY